MILIGYSWYWLATRRRIMCAAAAAQCSLLFPYTSFSEWSVNGHDSGKQSPWRPWQRRWERTAKFPFPPPKVRADWWDLDMATPLKTTSPGLAEGIWSSDVMFPVVAPRFVVTRVASSFQRCSKENGLCSYFCAENHAFGAILGYFSKPFRNQKSPKRPLCNPTETHVSSPTFFFLFNSSSLTCSQPGTIMQAMVFMPVCMPACAIVFSAVGS